MKNMILSFDARYGASSENVAGALTTGGGMKSVMASKARIGAGRKAGRSELSYTKTSNGVLSDLLLGELKRNPVFDLREPLRKMVFEAACRLAKIPDGE